jgi:hypothetical protein
MLSAAIVASLLFAAGGAGAAATFTDATGDAVGGAADFTQVVVDNDAAGTISFVLTFANRTALSSDDIVVIPLDTDENAATGFQGFDFLIGIDSTGARLFQGTGTGITPVTSSTLKSSNGGTSVSINRSELGNTHHLNFGVDTGLASNETAEDLAPETSVFRYDLALIPQLGTLAARFSPAKPRAGHVFRLAGTTLRLDDGSIVKAESITCRATLNGKRLAGRCSWRIPKNARGKRLVVYLTVTYNGDTATFTPWRFVVGR